MGREQILLPIHRDQNDSLRLQNLPVSQRPLQGRLHLHLLGLADGAIQALHRFGALVGGSLICLYEFLFVEDPQGKVLTEVRFDGR